MEGMAYALLDTQTDGLDKEGREFASRIVKTARQMDYLIKDLLNYSRVNQDEIQLEPIDLQILVSEIVQQLQPDIRNCGAKVTIAQDLPSVLGHRTILLQVVENLLSNALKFTAAGTAPKIELGANQLDHGIRLWIKDNGIGIDPKHHEKIFQVLERLHDIESYPGTGIGLGLVKKGVQRLGGRVGVDSAPGQGSTFWIDLPRAKSKAR